LNGTTYRRIRYINYIINLVVQVFLFYNLIEMEQLKSYDEEKRKKEETDNLPNYKIIR
jgi:hypothetical protein